MNADIHSQKIDIALTYDNGALTYTVDGATTYGGRTNPRRFEAKPKADLHLSIQGAPFALAVVGASRNGGEGTDGEQATLFTPDKKGTLKVRNDGTGGGEDGTYPVTLFCFTAADGDFYDVTAPSDAPSPGIAMPGGGGPRMVVQE